MTLPARTRGHADFNAGAILRDPERRTSGLLVYRIVGALESLGYPAWWLEQRIGRAPGSLSAVEPGMAVPDDGLMRDILNLAEQHKAVARPGASLSPERQAETQAQIDATRAAAARAGHRPPGDYDRDWEPMPEPPTPNPRRYTARNGSRDTAAEAARRLAMLNHFACHGGSEAHFDQRFGSGAGRAIARVRQRVGLKVEVDRSNGLNAVHVAPGQRDLVRAIKEVWAEFDATDGLDPLVAWHRLLDTADEIKVAAAAEAAAARTSAAVTAEATAREEIRVAAAKRVQELNAAARARAALERRRGRDAAKRAAAREIREAAALAAAERGTRDVGAGEAELSRTDAVHLVAALTVDPPEVTAARREVLRSVTGDGRPSRHRPKTAVREHAEAV